MSRGWHRLGGDGFSVLSFPDFLAPEECAGFIELIDADASRSQTFDVTEDADHRTSETCWMDHSNPQVREVYVRLCAALALPPANGERMQGQRYAPGQRFKPHHDFIRTDRPHWQQHGRMGGQRTWTAMIFLNAPANGGDTSFPLAGIRIAPVAGTLLAWHNLTDAGEPNPLSLHEGCEVIEGRKYIITQWYREGPCRMPGWKAAARRAAGRIKARLGRRPASRG